MHTLTVTATTSQGQQTSNTRTFLTNNRSPVPYLDQFDPPGTSANAPAVKCDTNDQNITSKAMYGDGGPDSLIHVTYSIPDYVSPTDAFIFRSSFNDWNSHSGTTGVNFQEIKSNQPIPADIIIEHTSNPTLTSCAAFWHYDNRLYYADAWQGSTGAQAIIEHEIGHYLGLDDAGIAPNPPSIMNQPSNPVNFCSNPNVETYTIQPRDASTIPTCRSNVKTYMQRLNQEFRRLNPPPPPTQQFNVGGSPNPVQTCTYSYYGVDYYVDGTYQGTDWYLDTVSCF